MSVTIHNLHHVNIMTSKLEETRAFYERVLGLTVGGRPATIPFNGYWLYLGEHPILHLLEIGENAGRGNEPVNQLDHFGVMATGMEAAREMLREVGAEWREAGVGEDHIKRFFVKDPNNITVELAFLVDRETEEEVARPPAEWYVGAKFYDPLEA